MGARMQSNAADRIAQVSMSKKTRNADLMVGISFLKMGEIRMENVVIVAILVIVIAFGVYSTVKHFKGQGECCGGGSSYKVKRKKLSNVRYQKKFRVSGMHCDNCKNRVEEVVGDIKGVAGRVDLKKGELTVSYAEDVADDLIKERIERAGYKISEISQ